MKGGGTVRVTRYQDSNANVNANGEERRGAAFACELVHRKIMYVLAIGAWSFNKGASLAIHDARNTSKAICVSPRHAKGERPIKLGNFLQEFKFVEEAVR